MEERIKWTWPLYHRFREQLLEKFGGEPMARRDTSAETGAERDVLMQELLPAIRSSRRPRVTASASTTASTSDDVDISNMTPGTASDDLPKKADLTLNDLDFTNTDGPEDLGEDEFARDDGEEDAVNKKRRRELDARRAARGDSSDSEDTVAATDTPATPSRPQTKRKQKPGPRPPLQPPLHQQHLELKEPWMLRQRPPQHLPPVRLPR